MGLWIAFIGIVMACDVAAAGDAKSDARNKTSRSVTSQGWQGNDERRATWGHVSTFARLQQPVQKPKLPRNRQVQLLEPAKQPKRAAPPVDLTPQVVDDPITDPFGDGTGDGAAASDAGEAGDSPTEEPSITEGWPPLSAADAAGDESDEGNEEEDYEEVDPVAEYEEDCRLSREYLLGRRLADISLNIEVTGSAGEDYPVACDIESDEIALANLRDDDQELINFTWTASGLFHKPLYFEEVRAERHGQTAGCLAQPILSAAHFFATAPILPYKMGLRPPCENIYALGHYRPGNCAPHYVPAVPISLRAGLWQAGAVLGAVYILP